MSDNIPFEIQIEIIQRIPDIKWLIQYRSVSKAWKSVIDSKDFVTAHTLRRHHQAAHNHHHHHHHLLIREDDYDNTQVNYVSIVDDDDTTFPHQNLSVFVPDSVNKLSISSLIVCSSHGLFCLYERVSNTAVIWNPSIRKTVATKVPNVLRELYYWTVVGFGVCRGNLEPKLVKITFVFDVSRLEYVNTSTQVEVFTLSSGGTWRSPLSSNVPHKSIRFRYSLAGRDGFIYWNAVGRINVDDGCRNYNLIMSFDLTSEEFAEINLPDRLALNPHAGLSLSNLRESLAILEFDLYNRKKAYDVWMMIGNGCNRSFNKLYTINAPDASIVATLGFRKSGTPIIEVENDNKDYLFTPVELGIYEPESKSITNIGIHGLDGTLFVHSYMETLLLLGH